MHRSATGVKTGAHKIAFEIFCLRFAYNFRDPRFLGPAVCDWCLFLKKQTRRCQKSMILVDFHSVLALLQWSFVTLYPAFGTLKSTIKRIENVYWSFLQCVPVLSYWQIFNFPFWEIVNKQWIRMHWGTGLCWVKCLYRCQECPCHALKLYKCSGAYNKANMAPSIVREDFLIEGSIKRLYRLFLGSFYIPYHLFHCPKSTRP